MIFVFVCIVDIYRVRAFFFFQAEDGIRDLVRSRGLGDVYKRQELEYLVKEKGAKLCKVYQPEDDGPINDRRLWPFLSLIHI